MRLSFLINSTTMSEIRSKLEGVDWSSVYSINSVNESYDTFSSLLTSSNSISFPLQPACSESHRSSNPGSQKLSLLLVKGKILFTNSSKLNPTALNKLRNTTNTIINTIFLPGKSTSITNFLSIHSTTNSMFLVLYSHTLIAFYLPLSPRSFILIMIFI